MATLFGKAKAGGKRDKLIQMFQHVVSSTQSATGFALVPKEYAEAAVKYEPTLLEINVAVPPDASNNVQVRATAAGIQAAQGGATSSPTPETASGQKSKPTFELLDNVAVPEAKRGGIREATYPFESMKVGQMFFIAATAEQPNPAKAMGSTVNSANRRYAAVYPATVGRAKTPHAKAGQPTGKDGRKFVVRPWTNNGVSGAGIWRTK